MFLKWDCCPCRLVGRMNRITPEQVYFIALILASIGVGVCLVCVRLSGDLFYGTYRIDLFFDERFVN